MWPKATVVATDIDSLAILRLRVTSRGWRTGVCDFLNPRSQRGSSLLRSLIGYTDLVLLNPPFSCRGGKRIPATSGGVTTKCSLGLAFMVNSIDYLPEGGELIAVLPQGSLTSERDTAALDLLSRMGNTEVLKNNGFGTFDQAEVRTAVVRFYKRHNQAKAERSPGLNTCSAPSQKLLPQVRIVRGATQMNEIQRGEGCAGSIPFIHSTHLQDFTICSHDKVIGRLGRCAAGPMVLLPRVGQPKRSKVAKHSDSDVFMLSDCVIALMCPNPESAELLWKDLQSHWGLLEQEYVGSGARYITNRRLSDLLTRLGYSPLVDSPNGRNRVKKGQRNGRCQNNSA